MGIGSFAWEIQGGILQQSDCHGFDFRIGAGSILLVSGVCAHINYLRFLEIRGSHDYFIGGGAGICYSYEFLFDSTRDYFYVGPNLVLGRKLVNEKGKIRFYDINFLFPIKHEKGDWFFPTISTGWMF